MIAPITHDAELDRTTIPLPGGWSVVILGTDYFVLHDSRSDMQVAVYHEPVLERMAREIHAAVSYQQDEIAAYRQALSDQWPDDREAIAKRIRELMPEGYELVRVSKVGQQP